MQTLAITICDSPEEAIEKGFNYSPEDVHLVELKHAVIVGKGTEEGNSTVDLQLVDESGKKYVAMVTGNILKSLAQAIEGTDQRLK